MTETQQTETTGLVGHLNRFAIENLDPEDILPRLLTPGIIPEHIARYAFARMWVDEHPQNHPLIVVDAAAGRGYGSDILKRLLPSKTKVVGVELGLDYVARAVEKYNPGNASDGLVFLQGDVRHLPLKARTADLVTAYEITEHLPQKDQQKFLNEIARVLRPGGYGLISIPYRYSFKKNEQGQVVRIKGLSNPHHLYEPTADEMREMLAVAGLQLEGNYGQVIVTEKQMDIVQKINQFFPIMGIYQWVLPQDASVQLMPHDENKVAFTQLFVAQKLPTDA